MGGARWIDGQIALAPTLSFILPKFKVIDTQNVRDQQPGDLDCAADQAREQVNIKINDLVISSLIVTQLLALQVFRVESKYALCSLLRKKRKFLHFTKKEISGKQSAVQRKSILTCDSKVQ